MRKVLSLLILALLLGLQACTTTEKKELVISGDVTWEQLAQENNKEPEWFKDSKLGVYFTWGPYTVPAFQSEWYPRWMYLKENAGWSQDAWRFPGSEGWARGIYEFHEKEFGSQTEFNYHDFIPQFKAEEFNAAEWAELFVEAGAKFAGPCAQHHDGYAMWDSEVNPWNAMDKGPMKDLVGELMIEFKKRDLKTIATFHHARNLQRYAQDTANWGGWDSHFPYHPDFATSSTDDELKYLYGNISAEEFNDYWYEQIREVVEGYAPDIIWFDNWMDLLPEEYVKKMVSLQYETGKSRGQDPVVVYKKNDLPRNVGVLDLEQAGMKEMSHDYWMTDITLSFASWSYVNGQTYKPVEMLLRNMIDVWSKKGIVLLNVCPDSRGIINQEQQTILKQMGAWLSVYGEAVYNTRAHMIYGYGAANIESGFEGIGQSATQEYSASDIRFTKSKDGKSLYIFLLGMPEENTHLTIHNVYSLAYDKIKSVSLLGSDATIEYKEEYDIEQELIIVTPAASEMNEIATVFKVEFE